ncbi:hypothetical protein F7725_007235 [Dissostichus mawsoni]|uniref:Uncharacterized protein n=1 Tax=Dissostichus mawsoni TaxID=36200 RepID=A0A7J5XX76_DISMA|nr:hypothetical protein F7725_007235 [Dissostichus mawsoni]
MVTVSTLERQHMASWSGTTTSNRATLSRGSHKRPGTDPSHNGHPSTNSTEKREHSSYPADAPGSQDTLFVSVMRFSLCDETLNDVRKDGEETE